MLVHVPSVMKSDSWFQDMVHEPGGTCKLRFCYMYQNVTCDFNSSLILDGLWYMHQLSTIHNTHNDKENQ